MHAHVLPSRVEVCLVVGPPHCCRALVRDRFSRVVDVTVTITLHSRIHHHWPVCASAYESYVYTLTHTHTGTHPCTRAHTVTHIACPKEERRHVYSVHGDIIRHCSSRQLGYGWEQVNSGCQLDREKRETCTSSAESSGLSVRWCYPTSVVFPGLIRPGHHAMAGSLIPPSHVVPFPQRSSPALPPLLSWLRAGLQAHAHACVSVCVRIIHTIWLSLVHTHYQKWRRQMYYSLLHSPWVLPSPPPLPSPGWPVSLQMVLSV